MLLIFIRTHPPRYCLFRCKANGREYDAVTLQIQLYELMAFRTQPPFTEIRMRSKVRDNMRTLVFPPAQRHGFFRFLPLPEPFSFAFRQRSVTAARADSERSAPFNFFARALPPLRPSATALGSFIFPAIQGLWYFIYYVAARIN